MMRNVEDDAVRVLHLAFEIAFAFVTEIEKEYAASLFDALLRFFQVVDLKAKMVRPDSVGWVREIVAACPRI